MPNLYNQQPIQLSVDFSSWRTNQTLVSQTSKALAGIRVSKITITAGTTTVAGTVSITATDGTLLYPTVAIPAGQVAGTVLYFDNLTDPLTWKDFSVTGLTATNAVLYLWYRA